ncbi:CHAT domain-containing protein/soluble cytochrome b562 [Bradyrhizobium sp. USDA 4354]
MAFFGIPMGTIGAFGFAVAIFVGLSSACYAAQDDRFAQYPREFLANQSNSLLQAAIAQDKKRLEALEKEAAAAGGFKTASESIDYAVALLATGKLDDAKIQLSRVETRRDTGARLSTVIRLVRSLVFLKERAFEPASRALSEACSSESAAGVKKVCRHLAAQVASLSGDHIPSLAAIRNLHDQDGMIEFPGNAIAREPSWDAVRVADYVVLKSFDEAVWGTYEQDRHRSRVRGNYVGMNDVFMRSSSSFGENWRALEELLKFEFARGNYQAALNWIKEFEINILARNWRHPIETRGYAARAYMGLGKHEDAEDELNAAEESIDDLFEDQISRYLAWIDLSRTFNVPGLEQLANSRLEKRWGATSSLKDIDSQLVAFEFGIMLLQNYSRIADLPKFEGLRRQIEPIALRIEGKIPARWPGKRFHTGWIELALAETILKYDPRPERLTEVAVKLDRNLATLKEVIDLTGSNGLFKPRELRMREETSQRNKTKLHILRSASDLQQELIPTLGRIYQELKSWNKAIPLLESAYYISMQESVCGRPIEQSVISIRLWQVAQKRNAESDMMNWQRNLESCLLIFDNKAPQVAWLLAQRARSYLSSSNYYGTEFALARAIWIQRELERPNDRILAAYLHQHAEVLHAEGRGMLALDLLKESGNIITSVDRQGWTPEEQTLIERQIAIYADLVNTTASPRERVHLLDAAFELSQKWLSNEAGRAVEALARRNAIKDEKLASLVQKRGELSYQRSLLESQFASIIGTSSSSGIIQARQNIATQLRKLEVAMEGVDKNISAAGNELISVPILKISEVVSRLDKDEQLIYFVFGTTDVVRWTIAKDKPATIVRLPTKPSDMSKMIAKVRCSVDTLVWSSDRKKNTRSCAGNVQPFSPQLDARDLPFELEAAHSLYLALFQGIDGASETWTIIPSGALASLSFATLAISVPESLDDSTPAYAGAEWLGIERTLNFLPAISSLRSRNAWPSKAHEAYVGFGNPIAFNRPGETQINGCHEEQTAICRFKMPKSLLTVSGTGQASELSWEPIPQTACEICTIGRHFSREGTRRSLYVGSSMTRSAIKAMGAADPISGRSALQSYRIVHFATHGIMAGQFAEAVEPGLVMSAPQGASRPKQHDLILTTGDIAELKLDAEWVILSACNTAAGNRPGGEALSGLARAFLYAGARSVLVSHWSVFTDAAILVSTSAIQAMAADPTLTRPQALRVAITKIHRQGRAELALGTKGNKLHPAYWGAFSLIGDTR